MIISLILRYVNGYTTFMEGIALVVCAVVGLVIQFVL